MRELTRDAYFDDFVGRWASGHQGAGLSVACSSDSEEILATHSIPENLIPVVVVRPQRHYSDYFLTRIRSQFPRVFGTGKAFFVVWIIPDGLSSELSP